MKVLKSNKNLKRGVVVVAAAGLLAVSGLAVAGPGPGGWGFGFGPHLMRLAHRLNLTEEQEIQAVRARRAFRKDAKALHEQLRSMRGEVAAELAKPEPDAAKLHGLADQMMRQMNKTAHGSIDRFLELHRTLTPEQRETLSEHIAKGPDRRGRRGRGHRRGPAYDE